MFPFLSNSINCNLTITVFYLLSFFIYLLSLSICLLSLFIYLLSLFCYLLFVSAFISFSFFIWILLPLFLLFYMNSTSSFPSLFHFCLLGGFLCTIISYFCYMGVHNRQWHNIPLTVLISFIWGCTIASDTTFP